MITQMEIGNLFEQDGSERSPVCVDFEVLGHLETVDSNVFFFKACEWLEDYYDLNTDIAKIRTFYTR